MEHVDCLVIGAGAIGLAVARRFARAGQSVLVLERNDDFGLETSGRNSEVIHAGIYYPPGSNKALLCRDGRQRLVDYLRDRDLPHRLCGKLIVASTFHQKDRLLQIKTNAEGNGVGGLRLLDAQAIHDLEPELDVSAGLLSPETGILDSRAYLRALVGDIEHAGGDIAFRTEVAGATMGGNGLIVETVGSDQSSFSLSCKRLVNAAGLMASRLAHRMPHASTWQVPETYFARGTYYGCSGAAPFSHLVYPVPEPGGLGIHLTLDLAGAMRFGPDVEWIETPDYTLPEGRQQRFREAIARYWPGVAERMLEPAFCGVRPKLSRPGEPDGDFTFATEREHGVAGLIHLFGMESPGLTASLAIAERVYQLALA